MDHKVQRARRRVRQAAAALCLLSLCDGGPPALTGSSNITTANTVRIITVDRQGIYLNGGKKPLSLQAFERIILALPPSAWARGRRVGIRDGCMIPPDEIRTIRDDITAVKSMLAKHHVDVAEFIACD